MHVTIVKHCYKEVEIPDFEAPGDAAEWMADNWKSFGAFEGGPWEIEVCTDDGFDFVVVDSAFPGAEEEG